VALVAGTRLGTFEIAAQIGQGGMGEVYRALDADLGRHVAIKILPEAFAHDPERLARFEREAKTLAALNHPNIAQVYGFEKADGIRALVMELVEGETLADRIARGFIPRDDVLAIARQIADALDAAHEKGVIHRDLKPANVKVTSNGIVKVLDFGLAKHVAMAGEDSHVETTVVRTQYGALVGTVGYMSPEQARGQTVDKRTDIWAFGCVLYELLTGRIAFPGETLSDTMVAILDRAPDWSALPSGTPPTVLKLLHRCLDKDVRRRLRDVGDARLDLEEALSGGEPAVVTERSRPVRHIEFQRLSDIEGLKEAPVLSPDGKMVAFVSLVGGRRHIWIRLLAGGSPLQLTRDVWIRCIRAGPLIRAR
jgi:serine/threonine protein kinase